MKHIQRVQQKITVTKDFYQSYQYVEDMVKAQIDYEALKNDNPYDEESMTAWVMVEILTSSFLKLSA